MTTDRPIHRRNFQWEVSLHFNWLMVGQFDEIFENWFCCATLILHCPCYIICTAFARYSWSRKSKSNFKQTKASHRRRGRERELVSNLSELKYTCGANMLFFHLDGLIHIESGQCFRKKRIIDAYLRFSKVLNSPGRIVPRKDMVLHG